MAINLASPSLVGTIADLKTFNGAALFNDHICRIASLNATPPHFRWVVGLTGTGDDQLLVTPTAGSASGRWLRCDPIVDLKLPWVFNTADGSVLLTVPTGLRLKALAFAAEVTTAMTGLDTSSIGLNASVSLNPGGLGRIVGIQAGFSGIEGAEINTPENSVLQAGATLKQNVILAGYTGGAGFWHLVCALLQT